MRFEWDDAKNIANRKKHGVSFEEASTLFEGDDYVEFFDETHADDEDRFIAIGAVARGIVLVVYTERDGDTVRIIGARWAKKREVELYRSYTEGRRP